MNPTVKEKWVKALRSGEYNQGTGCLRSDNGHCCLGVLCDLYTKEFPDKSRWGFQIETIPSADGREGYEFSVTDGKQLIAADSLTLPKPVQEWAGLSENNPKVGGESLAELNDHGHSFNEISDLINAEL